MSQKIGRWRRLGKRHVWQFKAAPLTVTVRGAPPSPWLLSCGELGIRDVVLSHDDLELALAEAAGLISDRAAAVSAAVFTLLEGTP